MSVNRKNNIWITTEHPAIFFEDTEIGRLKKKLWDATNEEVNVVLREYEIPSSPELGKTGTYIQTTPRHQVIENRRKNDIVIIPVGCTENHGMHTVSGLDSFMVTQIAEAVRRYTAKQGRAVNLVFNPLNYGAHPYHHMGMPGTVIMPQDIVKETLIYVMLGLWNDGFRKQIIINNHGQMWALEAALHEFLYRYQLPGIFQVFDWHRAVREFFYPEGKSDLIETPFIHADEAETAVALLMFPEEMVHMKYAQDTTPKSYLPDGHFDVAVDTYRRPHRWSEGEGQGPIEIFSTPEGSVGKPTRATAGKAKRPIAAICQYLTLVIDQILETFPPGTVPPADEVTFRSAEEMKPYLKEPQSEGWKSVYGLPKVGI